MNKIQIGGIRRETPAGWNDMTPAQVIYVAYLFGRKLSQAEFKIQALICFLSIKRKWLKQIDPNDARALTDTCNFLLDPVTLTRNPVMRIRVKGRRLYGPENEMKSCTFGEWTRAQAVAEQWEKTREEKYLDRLCAILYRPKRPLWFLVRRFLDKTDCRAKFRERRIEKWSMGWRNVNMAVKYAIYLFFSGVTGQFPVHFPNLYRKKEEKSKSGSGWADLIISLADDHTDDESIDRVMNSNLYNVFIGLEKKSAEYYRYREEHPELFKNK